jgi:fermentation-respiration switch protein FrsA (DUF1100 family)
MKKRHAGRSGRRVWPILLAAGLIVGVIVAMAFFVRGFDSTGSDNLAAPGAGTSPSDVPGPTVTPSGSPSKTGKTKYVVPGGGPTITLGANDGGGMKLSNKNQHHLVARVTSADPIYAVGWLIPTSLNHSYGKDMSPGRSFTIDTTVTGRPYYSLLWVYAGKSGAPVTCRISIDGKVRSTQTTQGAYGRQVCYA